MSTVRKPRILKEGGRIAIYSPSLPGGALFPERLTRGVSALIKKGFQVYLTAQTDAKSGFTAGTAEQRANELNQLFANPEVDAIFCSIGGFNSNELLPLLDYEIISNNPKIFVGYSDVTALLLGIYTQSMLVTFHGPAVLPEWGEYPEPHPFTIKCLLDAIGTLTPLCYQPPPCWTDEFLDWSRGHDCRPRQYVGNPGWKVIREGVADGILIGGNIETLNTLIGTRFFPNFKDTILFIEATGSEAYLPRFQRALTQLNMCGILSGLRGLIVGKCPDAKDEMGETLESVVRRFVAGCNFPVAMGLDFGHTDPKLTLPIGVSAKLACQMTNVSLQLMEPAMASN